MNRMQDRVDTARAGLEGWIAGTKNVTLPGRLEPLA